MRLLAVLFVVLLLGCSGDRSAQVDTGPIEFKVLTRGEVIDLAPHVEKGTITVFDFYADWCPPCKKLNRSLVDMKKMYGDKLTIYKMDMVEWGSELAKHHNIKDLPYLMVYDTRGELLKEGPSVEVLPTLMETLNQ